MASSAWHLGQMTGERKMSSRVVILELSILMVFEYSDAQCIQRLIDLWECWDMGIGQESGVEVKARYDFL